MADAVTLPTTDRSSPLGRLAAWILMALVLANYAWTCTFGFINDDYQWVEQAARSTDGYYPQGPRVVFFLRPVVELSFLLNYQIAGTNAFAYHAFNLVLEALNVWLVWRLARLVIADEPAALFAAAAFAVHPSHPGAVTWVCGRAELMSAGCYLGGLLLHHRRRTAPAAVLFGVGLFARESAVSFPVAAWWIDAVLDRRLRPRWTPLAVYVSVLTLYAWARTQWTSVFAWQYTGLQYLQQRDWTGLVRAVANQLGAAADALLEPLFLSSPWNQILLCVLIVVTVGVAVFASRMRRAAGAGLMLIALLPFLGWAIFQPRYAYLPGVGLVVVLGTIAAVAAEAGGRRWRRIVVPSVCLVWLAASGVRTQMRNEQLRRNSLMSARLVAAVQRAAPQPRSETLFIVDGVGALRLGRDPWAHTPILLYGFADALRLAYHDHSLDVAFPGAETPIAAGRPVVRVLWTGQEAILTP